MAPSDLDQLLEMGFERARAEMAVKKSGGLQGAMDWLEKTQDTPLDELQDDEEEAAINAAPLAEGAVAMSLVCNECGKKFRNQAAAEFHASKTEHADFSESTEEIAPLTEEEKKARLEELREKVRAKKASQALAEKEEQKRNEKIRQKATKETQDLKEEIARKEQIKEAARKRQEKQEDLEAKRRIKAKIEADKEERRRKAEEAKAAKEGRAPVAPAAAAPAAQRPAATHNEARLRLQTPGGNIMKTLPPDTTLFEVAQLLQSENGLTVNRFIMNFPKKTFEGSLDFGKTLQEAGMVPSAALIVQ
ncbi:hypothetical protein DL771_000582 [Monosporascus sp. 5C6A]|nr:hypothetical protein DL771_000582 [Monosporascus sp. 5C6A]